MTLYFGTIYTKRYIELMQYDQKQSIKNVEWFAARNGKIIRAFKNDLYLIPYFNYLIIGLT